MLEQGREERYCPALAALNWVVIKCRDFEKAWLPLGLKKMYLLVSFYHANIIFLFSFLNGAYTKLCKKLKTNTWLAPLLLAFNKQILKNALKCKCELVSVNLLNRPIHLLYLSVVVFKFTSLWHDHSIFKQPSYQVRGKSFGRLCAAVFREERSERQNSSLHKWFLKEMHRHDNCMGGAETALRRTSSYLAGLGKEHWNRTCNLICLPAVSLGGGHCS